MNAGAPRLYLDANAGIAPRGDVIAAIAEALGEPGNPSAPHGEGRRARSLLERARRQVAERIGCPPDRVIFTSGGVEACHLAIAQARGGRFALATEHPCVLEQPPAPERVPVDRDGLVDLEGLDRLLARNEGALLSIAIANNETGVLQPIGEIARIARKAGVLLHVDGVQALGKTELDWRAAGADFLALSAHKIGGPKGVGALVLGPAVDLEPAARGGGQERRLRAGTENLPGIVGFGQACSGLDPAAWRALAPIRDAIEAELARSGGVAFGAGVARLANTTSIATPGVDRVTQLMGFDLDGIAVSAGAACASGKAEPSHVLIAMGVDEALASCAIRISLPPGFEAQAVARMGAAHAKIARRALARAADRPDIPPKASREAS